MTLTIRAHFDGRVIVPDEPLALPPGQRLDVRIEPALPDAPDRPSPEMIAERLRRLHEGAGQITGGPPISNEALRRENLYDDGP